MLDPVTGLGLQGYERRPVHLRVPEQLQHRADCSGQIQIHRSPTRKPPISVVHMMLIAHYSLAPACSGQTDVHQTCCHHDHRLPAGLPGPLQPPDDGDQARGHGQHV